MPGIGRLWRSKRRPARMFRSNRTKRATGLRSAWRGWIPTGGAGRGVIYRGAGGDRVFEQIANVAIGRALSTPTMRCSMHTGSTNFPSTMVAAFDPEGGASSPPVAESSTSPAGLGGFRGHSRRERTIGGRPVPEDPGWCWQHGHLPLDRNAMDAMLAWGARWAAERAMGGQPTSNL